MFSVLITRLDLLSSRCTRSSAAALLSVAADVYSRGENDGGCVDDKHVPDL